MLSFFPRGVLVEILKLIESVSESFPTYSCIFLEIVGSQLQSPKICETRVPFLSILPQHV